MTQPLIEEQFEQCEACGATIYPEHLANHSADRWEGRLLCVHCIREKRGSEDPALAAVRLIDEPVAAPAPTPIKSFNEGGITFQRSGKKKEFRRELLADSPNATRCRLFHCKLNEASMAYMEDQINDWVDSEGGVTIKFATSTIGIMEGKHADPHLIVTVFY